MKMGLRELMFILVLLSVPVAAYWFVFRPRNAEIEEARAEIHIKEDKLDQLDELTKTIEDLGQAIDSGREAIDLVEAKLPSAQNVDEILKEVDSLARLRNLTLHTFEPDKKISASKYMELPLEVKLSGDFDAFYEFLLDLEKLERLTRMKDLKMKRFDSESRDGEMEAKFLLSIYFEPGREDSRSFAGVKP